MYRQDGVYTVPLPMEMSLTLLKMYRGKDCVEKFAEYIEEDVQWFYEAFPRQPMTRLNDVQKREHEAAEKCHICLKE